MAEPSASTIVINGVSFNGSANIVSEPYVESDAATNAARYLTFVDSSVDGYQRLNEDADLSYNPSTNTLTTSVFSGALAGNANTATTLQTARTINGVSFNGSANITVAASTTTALTFNNAGTGAVSGTTFDGSVARTISYNSIGAPSTTGTGASGTWGINVTGNAGTATSATSATSATTATNLAGGSAGTVPYQSAAGTTAQLAAGTSGYYLRANGAAAPAWEAPATVFDNIKVAASETATGVVELATTVEAAAGTDTTRAVTPAGVKAAIDSISPGLTLMTAQATTSGTSKDFTGIPSWVKRVTVMFDLVSMNVAGSLMVQLGSTTVQTTGYRTFTATNGSSSGLVTTGFLAALDGGTSTGERVGSLVFTKIDGNTWVGAGDVGESNYSASTSGSVTLAGALDRVRVTTFTGTDVFDNGTVNVIYE